MSENKRLVQLLAKELDGGISAVERDELERLIRMDPLRRREREAWRKVTAELAASAPMPRLEVARMTARILEGRSRALKVRSFDPLAHFWVRSRAAWVCAASTLAAIAVVFFASRHPAPAPKERPAVVVKAPVDVFFDEGAKDDDRAALVEIRF